MLEYQNLEEVEPVEFYGIVAFSKGSYILLSEEVENPIVLQDRLLAIQKYRKSAHIDMTKIAYPRLPKQCSQAANLGGNDGIA